jgi:membrane protease YdiL (CAAX protease family)
MKLSKTHQSLHTFFVALILAYLVPIIIFSTIPILKQNNIPSIVSVIAGSLFTFSIAFWAIKRDLISFEDIGLVLKKLVSALIITIIVWTIFGIYARYNLMEEGDTLFNHTPILFIKHWIFVAFAEELFFRGYFFTRIKKWISKYNRFLSVLTALIISSLIFSSFHIPVRLFNENIGTNYFELLGSLKILFFTGLILGWIFFRTKNIFLVSFIHGGINAPLIGLKNDLGPLILFFLIVELYVLTRFIFKFIKKWKNKRKITH